MFILLQSLKVHSWGMLNSQLDHGSSVFCTDTRAGAVSGQMAGHELNFPDIAVLQHILGTGQMSFMDGVKGTAKHGECAVRA